MIHYIVAIPSFILFTFLSFNSLAIDSQPAVLAHKDALAGETILIFGDSLSAGFGIPRDKGWVDALSRQLSESQTPHRVINASISGETTGGGLARFEKTLKRHQPSIVLIELGGNDGLRGYPAKLIKKNLLAMTDTALASGAKVLLAGIHIPPNYGSFYTQQFYSMYLEIANTRKVTFIPFFLEGIATDKSLMQEDGIHPNLQAQPMVLNNVLTHLTPLLAKP